jgi:hypothetical protein
MQKCCFHTAGVIIKIRQTTAENNIMKLHWDARILDYKQLRTRYHSPVKTPKFSTMCLIDFCVYD